MASSLGLCFGLPIVDISPFLDFTYDDACDRVLRERNAVVESLNAACSQHGMFYLTAAAKDVSEVTKHAFAATAQLFNLPRGIKRGSVPSNPSPAAARGYLGLGAESGSGLFENKECFSFGPDLGPRATASLNALQALNVWPADYEGENVGLLMSYMNAMTAFSNSLSRAMAVALEDNDIVTETVEGNAISLMRLFHYFPRVDEPSTGSSAHTDWGMFTIVAQDSTSIPALQICVRGQWESVAPRENSFVVNIGDYLQLRTRGRWKSPLHRVVSTHRERTSLCYFHYPAFDTPMPKLDHETDVMVAGESHKRISFVQDQSVESGRSPGDSHLALPTMGLAIAAKWRQVSRGTG